jgi:protein-S-isoprenylcysteine O-methyltransferase Ste14
VQVEGFKEGINEDVVAAAYCQPIDETDPSISENADVVIPLNSRLSVNDATNNSMKTILNFFAFFVMILAAVVLVPIIYNMFIVDLVLDNIDFKPQEKLNRLCSIDIYVSIILLGFAFSFINYGIANNVPVFTSVGFYVLIFYLASFLYFQYNRTMNTDFVNKFLKKFGEPLASFDNVKNDISNLIIDNLKILVMNFKTKQEEKMNDKGFLQTNIVLIIDENKQPVKEFGFVNLFLLGGVYFVLYMIASYAGMNKSVGASSVLLSLPFYLFLFALYICIFIKYQRDRRILEENKKNNP